MRPRLLLPLFALTTLASTLASALAAPAPAPPWPQEGSGLNPDPSVTWGSLPNGLRYAVLPNTEPPNRVSLRLYVDAGSLMETDNQQGLAHFLEHMAFNGTTNFPAGEMVEYFQRLGMAFGSHTNAHTSFKETVYKLELPSAESAILDEGFKLLRDYADGMFLGIPEIDKERGVILSEKRSRDSPEWRSFVDWVQFSLPDSLISRRLPIGMEEVISNAPRDEFVHFYQRWYAPQRMVLVAAGQVEPAVIERFTRQYFDSFKPSGSLEPDPPLGTIPQRGLVPHHFYDAESPETSVSIETLRPFALGPDTPERRFQELVLRLAHSMLARRLEILTKEEGSPLVDASAHHRDIFDLNFAEYASLDATTKPGSWAGALGVLEQELRRALDFGFTTAELDEARSKLLNQLQNQAKSAPTRKSRDLADALVNRLGMRRVFTHPQDDLARVEPLLDTITPALCLEAFQDVWTGGSHLGIHVSGNASIPDHETSILDAYRKSQAVPVTPPALAETAAFAYAAPTTPGQIAARTLIEDLGITQMRFANEVRANLKATDFEQDTVHVSLRFGAGRRSEPAEKPGLTSLFNFAFAAGGLDAHSHDDLQRIFAGKTVRISASVEDDAFVLSARTTPADLLPQLELLAAYLSHPGYRSEAQRQFDKSLDPLYTRLSRTPDGILANDVALFLHGGDRRFGYPPQNEMSRLTLDDLRAWVDPALHQAYLEVSLAGAFDLETAVTALARTLGNLPARDASKPGWAPTPEFSFPEDRSPKTYRYPSEIPKSYAMVYWPTADMTDIQRTRRLGLLANIVDDRMRLKIREELGEAYSPYARNVSSDTFTGYGYLFAMVEADPAQTVKISTVIADIAKDLFTSGVSEDELERARKPLLIMIEEYRRTNRYWLDSVLGRSQEQPERIEWARSFVADYQAMSKAEIDALAQTYLSPAAALPIIITPVP